MTFFSHVNLDNVDATDIQYLAHEFGLFSVAWKVIEE